MKCTNVCIANIMRFDGLSLEFIAVYKQAGGVDNCYMMMNNVFRYPHYYSESGTLHYMHAHTHTHTPARIRVSRFKK